MKFQVTVKCLFLFLFCFTNNTNWMSDHMADQQYMCIYKTNCQELSNCRTVGFKINISGYHWGCHEHTIILLRHFVKACALPFSGFWHFHSFTILQGLVSVRTFSMLPLPCTQNIVSEKIVFNSCLNIYTSIYRENIFTIVYTLW